MPIPRELTSPPENSIDQSANRLLGLNATYHLLMNTQIETISSPPPYELIPLRAEIDYYGASSVLSRYCGVDLTNKPMEQIAWSHGWIPDFYINSDPRIVTGQSLFDKNQTLFTSKASLAAYLKSCGYENTHAIGLPLVYLKEKKIDRVKNSLLVMPAHSLDYTTHDSWKFAEYVAEIEAISKHFEHIHICIHPSCLKHGYWVKEFQAKGFKIVEGINIYDKNALYRLQHLMRTFEYVTTNSFGSHIAYGAYFGAKVSIYGSYAEFKKDDFETDPFYTLHKDILDASIELISKTRVERELSTFFTSPIEAPMRLEWGGYEVGAGDKVKPREIRALFNLDWSYTKSLAHHYREWVDCIRSNGLFKPKA